MTAKEVVQRHLRAVEAGEWNAALALIGADYRMSGTIPFPINLFVKIRRPEALRMHMARKRALPDFRFNEQVLRESDECVELQIALTGTHTGVIDYTGLLRGIPVIGPTGRQVALPPEFFTYWVRDGLIVRTHGRIPKNAGVQALVRAVTTD